jgi:hypothetical protein
MTHGRTNFLDAKTPEGTQRGRPALRKKGYAQAKPKPRGAGDLERGNRELVVKSSTPRYGLGRRSAFERRTASHQETDQKGQRTSKEELELDVPSDHTGVQVGETSEGCEPHECDQAETCLGIIGRCQGVERLRKPEGASKSD